MSIYGTLAKPEDFDAYYELKSEEDNIHWSGHKTAPDREKMLERYQEYLSNPDRYDFHFFTDETKQDFIGYYFLEVVGPDRNILDGGMGVLKRHGGKGYGTEMIRFGLEYARDHLPFIRWVQGWVASDNVRSQGMIRPNGYVKTDETKEVIFGNGEKKLFEKHWYEIKR